MAARRQLISSGGPFEAKFGYSRAVRVGNHVAVAGTAAIKDGAPFAPGDAAAQTRYILDVIERRAGRSGRLDVRCHSLPRLCHRHCRLRGGRDEMGRVFGDIRPAGTMVGNSTLINPDLRVEIEVDAIVDSANRQGWSAEEVNLDETES